MNASSEVDNATARAGEPVAGLSQEEISNQLLFVIEGVVLGSVACLGIAGDVESCKRTITITEKASRQLEPSSALAFTLCTGCYFHGSYSNFMNEKLASNGILQ